MKKIPNSSGKEWPRLAIADNASFGNGTKHPTTESVCVVRRRKVRETCLATVDDDGAGHFAI